MTESRALHHSYEKAGRLIHGQPIPWNADGVLIEAQLDLRSRGMRTKEDYHLEVGERRVFEAESIAHQSGSNYNVTFRIPPIDGPTEAHLKWRDTHLGEITLPYLSREDFLAGLRLHLPTLFVRIGDQNVSARTFVANQCRGLLASAVLQSPTSLIPLAEQSLEVEFHNESEDQVESAPVRFTPAQLEGRQAMMSVLPKRYPRRVSEWNVSWRLGEQVLESQRISGISQRQFEKSLRVSSTRFVVQEQSGPLRVCGHCPSLGEVARLGPCFLIHSRQGGMAGLCTFQIAARDQRINQAPEMMEQQVLVSDGLTMVVPGTLKAEDLATVSLFDLLLKGKSLGTIPLRSAPRATFNAEGGFTEAPEHAWSAASDQELSERLSQLLDG